MPPNEIHIADEPLVSGELYCHPAHDDRHHGDFRDGAHRNRAICRAGSGSVGVVQLVAQSYDATYEGLLRLSFEVVG